MFLKLNHPKSGSFKAKGQVMGGVMSDVQSNVAFQVFVIPSKFRLVFVLHIA